MPAPELSVIIPTYNRGALVREAIDSVLGQEGGRRIEVVVVDDGSTDDTPDVLAAYGDRIRAIRQDNRGMNGARNRGIAESGARYVALLDSDDVWLPFKADLQIEVLDRLPDVGFLFTNFFVWRGDDRIPDGTGSWLAPDHDLASVTTRRRTAADLGVPARFPPFDVSRCEIYRLSLHAPVVLPSTSIVRREALDAIGPMPEDSWLFGDLEYFARMSKRFGAGFVHLETTLNRSHDDGVRLMRRKLSDRTVQRLESIERVWRADREFMAEHGDEVATVEAREWATLFKLSCYAGERERAARCLREYAARRGSVPWSMRAVRIVTGIPGARHAIRALREGLGSGAR